ncbi:hypothetical protein KEJ34_09580, partial [Candidatus Bathyarchaeota archaeon]|nr:hypothetical protein [Candidatus Bathyarchaeota archaeon]
MKRKFTERISKIFILPLISSAFSSLTLWLIDSWIKYPLFFFQIATIILLFSIINDYDLKITIKGRMPAENIPASLILDLALVLSSIALLIADIFQTSLGLFQVILSLLCTSLLSGYALLNISGISRYFSNLENVVLSYITSYILTAFLTLLFIITPEYIRTKLILATFIGFGIASIIKHERTRSHQIKRSLTKNIDALAIIFSLIFYIISFCIIYPGFAHLPGMDISWHYSFSIVLWRTPELYKAFNYFLAHLHESAFIAISKASLTYIQMALVTLNLMMPLAFYVMAKSYLEDVDHRLPAISTIFYATFSGFAWVYLAKLKLEGSSGNIISLLGMVNDKAYNGAMYLAQPYLWFVPLSASFTILMVQLSLLKKLEIRKKEFIVLFSLLIIASYLVHITEAIIFTIFLCFYAFFSRSKDYRLDDAIQASIIGFIILDVLYVILYYMLSEGMRIYLRFDHLLATTILFLTKIYRRSGIQNRFCQFYRKLHLKPLVKITLYLIIFLYFLGLITWIGGIPLFHTWAVVEIGSIPWFIYPVFLGVLGILGLFSIYHLSQGGESANSFMPFIALSIFSLLFGRTLTFVNLNLFNTGYWEKRMTAYFFLAFSILAPISMLKFVDTIKTYKNKIKNIITTTILISTVTVYGIQSIFIVLEHWSMVQPWVSDREFEAIDFLKDVLERDRCAYTVTLTSASDSVVTFSAPPYKLTGRFIVLTSLNPEMPLLALKAHNLSHAYLYMHSRDYASLNRYGQSWLAKHLLPMLPVIYRNEEVTIYNSSSVSFPQTNSATALVIPYDDLIDPKEGWLYAYDMLSLGEYNYTVFYDLDPSMFSYDLFILSIDPPEGNILKRTFRDNFSNESGWLSISGDWRYTDQGLQVGKMGEYQDAMFISPVSAQNFTASLTFMPLDGDLRVANYVSIIYDWKDKNNFKYAGLMFDGSGVVYAYFSSYKDGVVVCYPKWPGLNTGLRWGFGDSFNLTVSADGEMARLYVNGRPYLRVEGGAAGGKLGIRMTKFYDVLFTSFEAEASLAVQLRDVMDYLEHVRNGGRLIVFNTNGYGYFSNRMLKIKNSSLTVDEINGSVEVKLPLALGVPILEPRSGVEPLALYISQEGSSIYAAVERHGSGEIIYVNIYPIISASESNGVEP